MAEDDRDVEVFERIPWEHLERSRPDRRWMIYLAAGALVLASVGVTVGRRLGDAPQTPVAETTAPLVETTAPLVETSQPVVEEPRQVTTAPTTAPAPEAWAEADLLAVGSEHLAWGAASVAEWYLTDLFTRDGADPDDPGRSFVEWAGAVEVHEGGPGRFGVRVVVRRLAAVGEEGYRRIPDTAYDVDVSLGDGGWVIAGPPSVSPLAAFEVAGEVEPGDDPLPPPVAAAVEEAGAVPVGAVRVDELWRVSATLADPVGLEWPLTLWFEGDGTPAEAHPISPGDPRGSRSPEE